MGSRTPSVTGRAWALAVTVAITASCTASGGELVPTPGGGGPREDPLWPVGDQSSLGPETSEALQAVLDGWLANQDTPGGDIPGVTAAVVTADGAWGGAAGVDGTGAPLRPESAGAIGSITKTFIAAAVMRLAGRGEVDLDEPVSNYVDLPFGDDGATVRQVLGMQSGFPQDPLETLRRATTDPDREWTVQEVLDLVVPATAQGTLGGEEEYNNLNYLVLGLLVEQVTGEPLAMALRRHLLGTAGVDRVWVQTAEEPTPPFAIAAGEPDQPPVDLDGPFLPSRAVASGVWAAGGMAADAPSIAKWGHLLYGGHVVDASLVEQMTRSDGAEDWYGLGTFLFDVDGERVVGHGGFVSVYHSLLFVWPTGTSVAVLVPADVPVTLNEERTTFGLLRALHAIAR